MDIKGLATDRDIQKYLEHAENVSVMHTLGGIPVFKRGDDIFLGGYKSFYTFIPVINKKEIDLILNDASKKYADFQPLISVPFKDSRASLINHVLNLEHVTDPEKRLDIYEKKTRNLVRKSYKNEFTLTVTKSSADFYTLYKSSIERLGGNVKTKEWFDMIEHSLGQKIVIFSLYDGEKFIAANYCIVSGSYAFLMFNVSDPAYWKEAVNDRIYDELIRWAISNKMAYLDFGPGTAHDDSHAHFKEGFGAVKHFIVSQTQGTAVYRLRRYMAAKRYAIKLRLKRIHL
jgi:lipid II:glycine glycyltransferase (peptidoglycan interpeptide bridge formation enzyme)